MQAWLKVKFVVRRTVVMAKIGISFQRVNVSIVQDLVCLLSLYGDKNL